MAQIAFLAVLGVGVLVFLTMAAVAVVVSMRDKAASRLQDERMKLQAAKEEFRHAVHLEKVKLELERERTRQQELAAEAAKAAKAKPPPPPPSSTAEVSMEVDLARRRMQEAVERPPAQVIRFVQVPPPAPTPAPRAAQPVKSEEAFKGHPVLRLRRRGSKGKGHSFGRYKIRAVIRNEADVRAWLAGQPVQGGTKVEAFKGHPVLALPADDGGVVRLGRVKLQVIMDNFAEASAWARQA